MNTVQITGNLVKDPVIRATKTGKAVASLQEKHPG
jgi:single-stranded DNA-binding protein